MAGSAHNDKGMTMIQDSAPARCKAAAALAGLALLALGGCASMPMDDPAPRWQASFGADLRACQTAQGGRPSQRRQVAASHPRIATCLRLRGWSADGTPSLERLLPPG
jgi:hypothetical protein